MAKQKSVRWQLALDFEESELARCAEHIRKDLHLTGAEDYEDVLYLAEIHGGEPVPFACIDTGETEGEVIRINPRLSKSLMGLVILHELIHRLANSDRYIDLNPVCTRIPRRAWLELLARRVSGEGSMH